MQAKTLVHRCLILIFLFTSVVMMAQQPPVSSPLLDHLNGNWVMQGSIANQAVTHDVSADWVLDHHYLRIQEVSREKNDKGKAQYEAMVFVAWNEGSKQYSCAWMDVYGGLTSESIGVASPKENEIDFTFKDEKGNATFQNDFVYDAKADTWEWRMDNLDKGVAKPFARVKLSRSAGSPKSGS